MALQEVDLLIDDDAIPEAVQHVLLTSHIGVNEYLENHQKDLSGFIPSCPESVYRALRSIFVRNVARGFSFCEWGSGYGTVTCLAAILGFEAVGIEIDPQLVNASRGLANRFELSAVFAHGSFVPAKARALSEEAFRDNDGRYPWLQNRADSAYHTLGLSPEAFDVVFAYPWPGEEYFVRELFHSSASTGALLLSYNDTGSMTLLRKTASG